MSVRVYLSGICLIALAVVGCGPSEPVEPAAQATNPQAAETVTSGVAEIEKPAAPPAPTSDPVSGDTIMNCLNSEPPHLNPILATQGAVGAYVGSFIFETMVDIDNETLEIVPHIAERWKISDDHLAYTFFLRDDVTFSDGTPLTAHDVLFSYEAIMNPEHDTANLRNYLNDVDTVEVVDDHTITFNMKQPYFRNLLACGAIDIMPKHIYEGASMNDHPNNRKPVGSGPYVFDSWNTGQNIVLSKSENYWGEPVYLDTINFKIITDENVAVQVLEKGELDMLRMQPEQWVTRAARPEFEEKFYKFTPFSQMPGYVGHYRYIAWNMRKPQFEDKRVRQALTMLLDRQLMLDEIWHGLGQVATGSFSPRVPEHNKDIKPWPYDPVQAMKLLDEAGWIDADRDGVREKDGNKLEFELSFTVDVAEYVQMSNVYQEELERAGIKMTQRPLEWATFQQRVHERNFDACMLAWLMPIMPDPYQLWHSSQAENGSNYPGFKNEEADQIMDAGRLEFDHEKRIKLYNRFHEILHEEQPYTFLTTNPGLYAVDKRFENVKAYDIGLDIEEWWVPIAKQRYQ
jgi:peptide/nickel transport system substrate-binding protein